ncbi:MAG TPA: E2 domain-containing protein [Phenylobacterium sp.]|uniref:E2 domain-containing protein n=1 Tax=Phenylobacterium sp. TaxID=1871053 RepID=UPI002F92D93D
MRARPETSPADWLILAMAAYGATLVSRGGDELVVSLPVQSASGVVTTYVLTISAGTAEPRVRETSRQHLPSFCPERHINPGGWFCLAFSQAEPLVVADEDTAVIWWAHVWKFLSLQPLAARRGIWPGEAWAHGDAARHQLRARQAAEALGLLDALQAGSLSVRRHTRGFLRLFEGGRRLYSVWAGPRRTATLRQPCVCGSGRPLRSCSGHATATADLVFEMEAQRAADAAFWADLKGHPCCGTMKACPLAARAPMPMPANTDDSPAACAA